MARAASSSGVTVRVASWRPAPDQPKTRCRPPGPSRSTRCGRCPADGVEDDGGPPPVAEEGAGGVGPVGVGVVEGEVGAVRRGPGGFGGAAGQGDHGGAGVLGVLDEQGADAARRGGDDGHGVRAEVGELRGCPRVVRPVPIMATASAASRLGRDRVQAVGVGDGELGVAAGREAEVGDDALAEPGGVGALAERRRRCRRPRGRGWWGARRGGARARAMPSRRAVSRRCTPAAATAMRTWPGPGTGSSVCSYVRFSAGPKAWRRMACMGAPSGRSGGAGSCAWQPRRPQARLRSTPGGGGRVRAGWTAAWRAVRRRVRSVVRRPSRRAARPRSRW